jgi:hypothetical protein
LPELSADARARVTKLGARVGKELDGEVAGYAQKAFAMSSGGVDRLRSPVTAQSAYEARESGMPTGGGHRGRFVGTSRRFAQSEDIESTIEEYRRPEGHCNVTQVAV